jgi:hypothetical protein
MRYAVAIRDLDEWSTAKEGAAQRNSKKTGSSREWAAIFKPTFVIPAHTETVLHKGFAVVLIEFDKAGFVKTATEQAASLRGRLNRLQYITLAIGDGPTDLQYDLGEWFLGVGDASTHWAPALCGIKQMPSPFSKTDEGYLYGPKYDNHDLHGTFGCREWAYQLYDPGRPYIDITSYLLRGRSDPATAVRRTMGWSRFSDRKPIIGKHADDWYCFLECPDADKPGYIPDIAAWTAKRGWPTPKPPTKAPTFPDPPAKPGTYPG